MDSVSHYKKAEQILADRADLAEVYGGYGAVAAMAQAHATLALVAVAALNGGPNQFLEDHHAWSQLVSVTAPIPPETDDEEDFDVAGVIHDLGDDGRCADTCTGCDVEPSPTAHLDDEDS